jgi:hypothetical protein
MRAEDLQMPAVAMAREISQASDAEVAQTVSVLRASKMLCNTVHELNQMLAIPQHRELAMRALKRLGLEYAG